MREGVACEDLDGELMALAPTTARLFRLSSVGGLILLHCDGRHSEDDIVDLVLARTRGADRKRIVADVAAFLSRMRREELVE